MLSNPAFEFRHIDGRQLGKIGPQLDGSLEVDMRNFGLRDVRVPVDENADTLPQRTGNVYLVGAEERHVEPAQLSSGESWKLGVQVDRGGKNDAGHAVRLNAVLANHECQQLPRRLQNRLTRILFGRRRPSYSSAVNHCLAASLD